MARGLRAVTIEVKAQRRYIYLLTSWVIPLDLIIRCESQASVDLLKWFATAVCKYPDGIDRWSHALPEVLAAIRELEE